MTDNGMHFMATHKGPAKQLVVIVGDEDGKIRQMLDQKIRPVEGEENCYFLETYYYSAKYGIKEFQTVSEIKKEFETDKRQMVCHFIAYKSIDQLKEAKEVTDRTNADIRLVIIESMDKCPEAEEVETYANANGFEVVYLKPNEEQRNYAKELGERIGVDRLVENLEVCNWPYRVCNAIATGKLPFLPNSGTVVEQKLTDDEIMGGSAAELVMRSCVDWCIRYPPVEIPAPQHAERVHLSPDSPTTTEGTTNIDDISVSVDVELVRDDKKNEGGANCGENVKTSTEDGRSLAETKANLVATS